MSTQRAFWGYTSGNCGIAILRQIILFMPMFFYCPPSSQGAELLDPARVGLALFVARLIDVISDPVVGYFSDRTVHRWGKRLPYIVYGAPCWLLATIFVFTPPDAQPSTANFAYLCFMATAFFIGMSVVQIPYMSVLPEVAWEEDHAVRVSARMGRFFILGVLLVMVGGWFLAGKIGFLGAVAVFCLVAAIPFGFTIWELLRVEQRPVVQYRQNFLQGILTIVRQKPFWTYLVGHSLFILGYYMILVASPYFTTEIVRLPKEAAGVLFILPLIVAMLAAKPVEKLSIRFGKKPVLLGAMLVFTVLFSLWLLVGRFGWWATTLRDLGMQAGWAGDVRLDCLAETLFLFALLGLPVSVQLLLPTAVVADLVLYDEAKSGERRESLVYGLQSAIEKNAVMVASLGVALCLNLGKNAGNPRGIYIIGPAAAIITLVGFLVFLLYPLNKGWLAAEKKPDA